MKITKMQLRKIIREALEQEPEFPDINHPAISQFADKTSGPMEFHGGGGWFDLMQSYSYNAGGSSDQGIIVYYKPNGKYTARIRGNYSNTLSSDRQVGDHGDAISAIEAALDSSPSGRDPFARDLLIPVGEKVKLGGYHRQD